MSEHVVVEIPFESMGNLQDRFENIFGEEHDSLWHHIPEIRKHIQNMDSYSEDEMPPPGFLTLPPEVMGALGMVLEATNSGVSDPTISALAGSMREAEVNGKRLEDPYRVNVVGDLVANIEPRSGTVSGVLLSDWLVTPGDHALRYEHSRDEKFGWLRIDVPSAEYDDIVGDIEAGQHLSLECTIAEGTRTLRALSISRFPKMERAA